MSLLNKTEKKILLTFFLIFSLFVYWIPGGYEDSNFALVRAIVDEGRLEIDTFYKITSDRAIYNSHYYTDKDPGVALTAAPVYASLKIVFNFFPPNLRYDSSEDYIILLIRGGEESMIMFLYPGILIKLSMMFLTIITSSLPAALLVVLFYKTSKFFIVNKKDRLMFTFSVGLGTLILPYALRFMQYSLTSLFSFSAFYLLFKTTFHKAWDEDKRKITFISGTLTGLSMLFNALNFIPVFFFIFYILMRKRRYLTWFLLGIVIGLLPYAVYNTIIFGTPFEFMRNYYDTSIWTEFEGFSEIDPTNLFVVFLLLFHPLRGLFVYYPIFLLSFFGMKKLFREFKLEVLVILLIFLMFLHANSLIASWWGGACFGPRHLVLASPFLVFAMIPIFKSLRSNRFKYLILALIIYSIFINILGLQPVRDEIIEKQKFEYFGTPIPTDIENPIIDYYFPLFLKNGPRSRIIESLTNSEIPDIRYSTPIQWESFGLFYFFAPYLPLIFIVLILLVFWWLDLPSNFKIIFKKYEVALPLILIFIFFYVSFVLSSNLEKGWYLQTPNEEGLWMMQDGTLVFFNNENMNLVQFSAILSSYNISRDVRLYFNEEHIETFDVPFNQNLEYSFILNAEPGKNVLRLHSEQDCMIPRQVEIKRDTRCLSLHLWNYSFQELEENYIFSERWYPQASNEDGRWMIDNATLVVLPENQDFKLGVSGFSMWKTRNLDIYRDSEYITTLTFYNDSTSNYEININSSQDIFTTLLFSSKQNCTTPAELQNGWDDTRCLGIQFTRVEII